MRDFAHDCGTVDTLKTYVDEVTVVSNEEIAEDAGLVEVSETNHIVEAFHGRRVHRLETHPRLNVVFLLQKKKNAVYLIIADIWRLHYD